MKNFFFLLFGLIIIVGSVIIFLNKPVARQGAINIVKIGENVINVEISNTPETRAQGLSGRLVLPDNSGMLFIFETSDRYGFWMKEMNFAIDMVWINELQQVVGVEKSVSPDTFPKSFYPNEPVKYVLELPAGFSEKNGIDTGARVYFE